MNKMDILNRVARPFGYNVVTNDEYTSLENIEHDVEFLFSQQRLAMGDECKSQLGQDIFCLLTNSYKRGGFFVEFGATNGVDLSNTYLLEKKFNWTGILAEPAAIWHDDLKRHRTALIDLDCVWSSSGQQLEFETTKEVAEFSTISAFSGSDRHASKRKNSERSTVNTISLMDLLAKYSAPNLIEYLSVDTEGSELEILSSFDFSKYSFEAITVEHNYTPAREKIHTLLQANGYRRVFERLSKWDDWYIKTT